MNFFLSNLSNGAEPPLLTQGLLRQMLLPGNVSKLNAKLQHNKAKQKKKQKKKTKQNKKKTNKQTNKTYLCPFSFP
jgi:hypothetical protein